MFDGKLFFSTLIKVLINTVTSSATSGTDVIVTDPSTNASNLTGQYMSYYWKCNV